MPIDITCNDCSASYKVPDNVAGKKIRCPKCSDAVVQVPAATRADVDSATTVATRSQAGSSAGSQASSSAGSQAGTTAGSQAGTQTAAANGQAGKAAQWQLKTETGDVYGPVDKEELDQWVAEGRVNAQTQLLKSGDPQWQWATTVYPQLEQQELSLAPVGQQAQSQPYANPNSGYQNSGYQASGYQSTGYQQTVRSTGGGKSKMVAGILALVPMIGPLGIHNFYLGFVGRGVAQLLITVLSCGILSLVSQIWAFIEGIMILTGSIDRDADGYLLQD